jgi:hypothetical protein
LKAANVGAVWTAGTWSGSLAHGKPASVREAIEQRARLENTAFADLVVETNHLTPIEVASRVWEQAAAGRRSELTRTPPT